MTVTIIRGDARQLPLPDASVDLVCTSPPYFGLRDYRDGDKSLAGQIGAEPTLAEYVAALLECTAEWMRVLKPSGSLFVNLGDKYVANAPRKLGTSGSKTAYTRSGYRDTTSAGRQKSLLGLPWRYALGCIDDLDLILRAEMIWQKPNAIPESVQDRVRRSHETWFHFTKQPRYFSAVDEIREAHNGPWKSPGGGNPNKAIGPLERNGHSQWERTKQERDATVRHPLGKLPGSVWEIATQPLKIPAELAVQHFAAFPMELPRRIITGWSPSGICTACGEGLRPVASRHAEQAPSSIQGARDRVASAGGAISGGTERSTLRGVTERTITGYACACPNTTAPSRPAVVLDPFGGTGTTALVADVLGRSGISVDMSADYCRLARWRTTDPKQRARVLGRPKQPPPATDGQGDLFEDVS